MIITRAQMGERGSGQSHSSINFHKSLTIIDSSVFLWKIWIDSRIYKINTKNPFVGEAQHLELLTLIEDLTIARIGTFG